MEDISLHLLDIAENSVAAGATLIKINISADEVNDLLSLEIIDNGRGIPDELKGKVLDPFYTTRRTRRVGFGLSLLAQSAKEAGGDMNIQSTEGGGTTVTAHFKYSHIDRKPIGKIADTFSVLIAGNPDIDFIFTCSKNGTYFLLDTREIKAELEGIPLNDPSVITTIRSHLKESLVDMK
jgi:hypothetical protein